MNTLAEKRDKVEKLVNNFRVTGFMMLALGGLQFAIAFTSGKSADIGTMLAVGNGMVALAPYIITWLGLGWLSKVLDLMVEMSKER